MRTIYQLQATGMVEHPYGFGPQFTVSTSERVFARFPTTLDEETFLNGCKEKGFDPEQTVIEVLSLSLDES